MYDTWLTSKGFAATRIHAYWAAAFCAAGVPVELADDVEVAVAVAVDVGAIAAIGPAMEVTKLKPFPTSAVACAKKDDAGA